MKMLTYDCLTLVIGPETNYFLKEESPAMFKAKCMSNMGLPKT